MDGRTEPQVVLRAIEQNWEALRYAAEPAPELVLAAAKQHRWALHYAPRHDPRATRGLAGDAQ